MRTYYLLGLFGLGLSLFALQSCEEANAAEAQFQFTQGLVFQYKAQDFIRSLEAGDDNFDGIIITYNDQAIQINKVQVSDDDFRFIEAERQPLGQAGELSATGEVYFPKEQSQRQMAFEFEQEGLDFVYFSWKEIRHLAAQSESLYLSGAAVQHGRSIHQEAGYGPNRANFSLKMEGDFLRAIASGGVDKIARPMSIVGNHCPPFWVIDPSTLSEEE